MNVGILGSGDVARALGRGFLDRGDKVMLGSRSPEKLAAWVTEMGRGAAGGSFEEAAAFGEVVVLASAGTAAEKAIKKAGKKNLEGKVVIDVTNPLVYHEDAPPTLAYGPEDSGGERVQAAIPDARVVKTLNIVNNRQMISPEVEDGPPTMFVCGEDPGAKKEVAQVLESFGWKDVIDIGGIDASRELESLCVLWVRFGRLHGTWMHAFRLLRD